MSSSISSSSSTSSASQLTFAQSLVEQDLASLANSDLSDRIVLVVGALSCGGPSIGARLARQGAQLVLVDQTSNEHRLQSLAESCDRQALHGNRWQYRNQKWQRVQKTLALTIPSPTLTAPSAIANSRQHYQRLVETIVDTFGRVDSFVFVGSGSTEKDQLSAEQLTTRLDTVFNRELLLFANLTQLLVPHLEKTDGTIVNVSTISALRPPDQGQGLCTAMVRSSIDMFVKCISLELGPKKIRINSVNHLAMSDSSTGQLMSGLEVNQSMIDQYLDKITDQGPNQPGPSRGVRPDDVSAAVLFLVTPRSAFLNGINLVVDGGKILQ